MDWIAFIKHFGTFGSSMFDISSDIINSLNFLGYFNDITIKDSSYMPENGTNVGYQFSNDLTGNHSNGQDGIHIIWGVMSLSLIFVPGILFGICFVIGGLGEREKELVLLGLSLIFCFPIAIAVVHLAIIIRIIRKRETTNLEQMGNAMIGFEASTESLGQIILQSFAIINGYGTNIIQLIAIFASFFQIGINSILHDIEIKKFIQDDDINLKETFQFGFKSIPCYASTIIFRAMSLCFTLAFLRLYAFIPLALLFVELMYVSLLRIKRKAFVDRYLNAILLAIFNLGSMNAYTCWMTDEENLDASERESDKDVVKFIRRSSIITTIHHTTVLSLILILAIWKPDCLEHWNSESFRLNIQQRDTYYILAFVYLLGFYSLTVLLYRAKNLTVLKKKNKSMASQKRKRRNIMEPIYGDNEE